ncbi:serine/threonine protein kinase [Kribbella qitaiheensis]|uniref:non-specific serine/threonine protein kinase n=1 Tax=Kribbella qitaiheensis TaxID=1544730 RepID=A0A7G6WWQ1_9ACTN|nr:serine/threonine-protein kinase [Kribbella qitaiheensis]QNE18416.1 serine/threonine protein kinase [Kribbella qitaiheensis]
MSGEVLAGRYRLLTLLGQGGAGEVWQAEDQVLARPVAVKLLRRLEGDLMDATERFRTEAQSAARLLHPNVVATYDVGTADGQVFLVMELVNGPDLAKLLRSGGLPPVKLVADIAVQGARALDAAHAAGIVHRDVKPGNLLLAPDGTLKITDFGIAQAVGLDGATGPVLLGTAAYVSPEQVKGERATPASDWYSLGCVLYELLAGLPPFVGENFEAVMRQHLEDVPVPIVVRRPEVSAGLGDLVTRLLAKAPGARPGSAAEVIRYLNQPAADEGTRVLAVLPAAEAHGASADAADAEPGADLVPGLKLEAESEPERSHRRRGFPLAKSIVAVAVVLVGVVIAALLKEGVGDSTAQARDVPTPPAVTKVTTKPKPTPTPSKTPSKTPTKKPKATPTPQTRVSQLHALAGLLRQTQEGKGARTAREAAKDLDSAAEALADGDDDKAAEKFNDARQRLVNAQREGRWQATPQIVVLFNTLSRTMPRSEHQPGNNNNE